MKCIKMCGTDSMKKVSDIEASNRVSANKAKYLPKSIYKETMGKGVSSTPSNPSSKNSCKKNNKKNKPAKDTENTANNIMAN